VLFCLVSLCSTKTPKGPSCNSPQSISVRKLKDRYVFVNTTGFPPRKANPGHHSGSHSGNKWCPWTWATDVDHSRLPPRMAFARCDNCNTACMPMYMHLDVLKWASQCDSKTGDKYREWSTVNLPIAYIYTGNI
jgi:hypothetical protein